MSTTHITSLPEWRLKKVDTEKLARLLEKHALPLPVSKALCDLGLESTKEIDEFLNPSLKKWHSDLSFPSLSEGARCFYDAIRARKKICIHGDFDSDGMLGTYILKDLLNRLGIEHLAIIPTREEGHGLSLKTIEKALQWGAQLLISVDCGINAIQEIEYARDHQLDVLITDHHLPDEKLPPAVAITNPQLDDHEEFKQLSGTGVAMKLALCTLDLFENCPISKTQFESFLAQSLVMTAIATVADVMELKGLNRALVQHALDKLDALENPGLQALIKTAKIKSPATTEDLSFQLIPRINSAQRMEQGELIWELLNCSTNEEAQQLCEQLEQLNSERKNLLEQHAQHVLSELSTQNLDSEATIIVEGETWLEGFSGLIAQRVIQKYQKPAIVMLKKQDNTVVASCRSPEGWHLKQALDECQDYLIASGGHAQAAGFRTHVDHLTDLKNQLQTSLKNQTQENTPNTKLTILHELNFRDINMGLFESLKILEPFGQGNPKPVFATRGLLFDGELRFMGKDKNHVGFQVFQPGINSLSAVAFGMAEHFRGLDVNSKFDLAYTLALSPYRPQLQLQVLGIRPHRTITPHRSSHT